MFFRTFVCESVCSSVGQKLPYVCLSVKDCLMFVHRLSVKESVYSSICLSNVVCKSVCLLSVKIALCLSVCQRLSVYSVSQRLSICSSVCQRLSVCPSVCP